MTVLGCSGTTGSSPHRPGAVTCAGIGRQTDKRTDGARARAGGAGELGGCWPAWLGSQFWACSCLCYSINLTVCGWGTFVVPAVPCGPTPPTSVHTHAATPQEARTCPHHQGRLPRRGWLQGRVRKTRGRCQSRGRGPKGGRNGQAARGGRVGAQETTRRQHVDVAKGCSGQRGGANPKGVTHH